LAIPAATQAWTVRAKTRRNRSAPQRWRTRVRLEWSGSASCRPQPADRKTACPLA
jgi:hypothetical protein